MSKIIKIENNIVFIGNENGSVQEIPLEDFNFEAKIGDEVEIYKTDNNYIDNKKKQ